MSKTPHVFISYSHEDQRFVDELMVHLAPLRQRYAHDLWSDQAIRTGDDWESEIKSAIANADIALLLVSAHYLASTWVMDVELAGLLARAERGETRVIPIILRPCAWAHTRLAYYQALPKDGKSLAELTESKKDRAWSDLTEVLEAELHRLTSGEGAPPQPSAKSRRKTKRTGVAPKVPDADTKGAKAGTETLPDVHLLKFFISHAKEDGDFAENLKGRLKEKGFDGWIDIDVLEAGVDWRKDIDEAILESRALILVLSPDSKSSEYVTYEWAFALGSGLRIVPLMLRDTAIHPRLEVFQYLDFTNRRARPWNRLFGLLADVSKAAPNNRLQADDAPAGRRG